MNIAQRLALIMLLVAIPVGVLQFISLREQYRLQRQEISLTALRTAQRAGAEQGRIIDGSRQLLAALSQLPAVRSGDVESCSATFKRLQAQFPMYLGIGVSSPGGHIWCSSIQRGTDVSDRAYFKQAVVTRKFTTGGYVIGRVSGQRSLNFSLPFYQPSGELAGVLVAGLDLDLLAKDLARAQLPAQTRLLIAGPDRRILVDLPGSARIGAQIPAALERAFNARRVGIMEAKWFDGSARLVGFVPPHVEPGGPFLIAIGIDRHRAFSAVATQGLRQVAILVMTLSVALLLAWWFAARFVRTPIRRLSSTIRAWREGDSSARVGRLDGGSEFDDLAQAFDAMAEAVDERQRRLRDALESTTDSVLTLTPDWAVTFLNERAHVRLGGSDLIGRNLFEAFPQVLSDGGARALREAMDSRHPVTFDLNYDPLAARFEVNAFPTPDGGLTLFIRDVTEQHRAQQELRYLALHDALTGLPNRADLMAVAAQKLEQQQLSAMILIDLDGFKHINDRFGHLTGDEMLRQVAQRLEPGSEAMIGRLGGDEFVALLFDTPNEDCIAFGDAIVERIGREPFLVRGRVHAMTVSCGIVLAEPASVDNIEDLVANADLALYRAKAGGGGACHTFTVDDRRGYDARRRLEEDITQAAAAGEFELHYQPQVRLRDGAWVGAEALLRWRHPQRGLLEPSEFIGILEHSRHARTVGEWILDEACREAASWWRMGKRLRVGVNLFADQIVSADLPGVVLRTLARHELPAEALELELTETIALAREKDVVGKLAALRMMGVYLAFDDFGTGFASLTTLKDIPVHRLKIDRSFVSQLPSGEHDKAIVDAVLALARSLGLEVIAEGVETEEQEQYLLSQGCQEAQGFRYARAMPAHEFRTSMLGLQDHAIAG